MLPAKIYTLLIAAMLGLSSTHAQTSEKALENLRQNFTTESIYIHFDNDVYMPGKPSGSKHSCSPAFSLLCTVLP